MSDLPTVMTAAGLQPIAPVDLRASLVAGVAATNPGYTADLPGTLIEDIASTDVGALVQCDQFRVELKRYTMNVSFEVPQHVALDDVKKFIEDWLESGGGCHHPDDPLFHSLQNVKATLQRKLAKV